MEMKSRHRRIDSPGHGMRKPPSATSPPIKKKLFQPRYNSDDFYSSRAWREVRYEALKQYGRQCLLCGRKPPSIVLHVDHIKPRSKYPELELEITNLQVLCEECNLGKSNKDETDWRPLAQMDVVSRLLCGVLQNPRCVITHLSRFTALYFKELDLPYMDILNEIIDQPAFKTTGELLEFFREHEHGRHLANLAVEGADISIEELNGALTLLYTMAAEARFVKLVGMQREDLLSRGQKREFVILENNISQYLSDYSIWLEQQ